jgi:UDP-N-acetylglucosamine--N-acetylmuramyl-(pentapeptide) pyrophosphoryl-undecaprenol N-acetylglucosamine transferase
MIEAASSKRSLTIALAAGGTGGHLFPAEALGRVLVARGHQVELISDDRVQDFASSFPARHIHQITSGTVTGKGILGKIKGVIALGKGIIEARGILSKLKPDAVIGFGGYPSVPPVLAAAQMSIPTVLHEQNGVMGRANRFLSKRVKAVATGFPIGGKFRHVGNPVRQPVRDAAAVPYVAPASGGMLNLLVFGGSQGARVMSEVLPAALALLSPAHRARLRLTQQARGEDLDSARTAYGALGMTVALEPFFKDMPQRIANSHLVVARSGASTVAELSVIGRPSILVPLPGSLDQDQAANAKYLASAGGALVLPQSEFTPDRLAAELVASLDHPSRLSEMAAKAKATGIPDAAERLADLVEKIVTSR